MSGFQVLALAVVAALWLLSVAAVLTRRMSVGAGIVWILLWTAAGLAIRRPELTMEVAHLLGIGRGADLVFYCATLVMLVGFFRVYLKLRRVEADLTKLVRRVALIDPAPPEKREQ
ncbi:MAG: DUF2304 domain-containing protein [Candidatus Binatia bacterium]